MNYFINEAKPLSGDDIKIITGYLQELAAIDSTIGEIEKEKTTANHDWDERVAVLFDGYNDALNLVNNERRDKEQEWIDKIKVLKNRQKEVNSQIAAIREVKIETVEDWIE